MARVFVARPSATGAPLEENARLVYRELAPALAARGHELLVSTLPGCSDVVQARSELAAEFFDSGAEYLLHLDDDVWCEPHVVLDLLAAREDVILATYPGRQPPHDFTWAAEPRAAIEDGPGGKRLLTIHATGLGLCLVRRSVVERLRELHPETRYTSMRSGRDAYQLYRHVVEDVDGMPRGCGEDWSFFARCRAAGYRVRALVDALVTHRGVTGRLSDVLPGERAWSRSVDEIPGWCDFEWLYERVVAEARDGDTLVEIGTAFGRSAAVMARGIGRTSKTLTFYAIDPMVDDGGVAWGVELAPWARSQGGPFNAFAASMREYARRELELVRLVRAPSVMAARMFEDASLGFVFVDGAHDEASVAADLAAWEPKIRPGGLLAGHDYSDTFPGVTRAVDARWPGVEVHGNVWLRRR